MSFFEAENVLFYVIKMAKYAMKIPKYVIFMHWYIHVSCAIFRLLLGRALREPHLGSGQSTILNGSQENVPTLVKCC